MKRLLLATGVGILAAWVVASGLAALAPDGPANPDAQASQVPIGAVDLADWGEDDNASTSDLRIAHVGSAAGMVEAGGATDVCARFVDPEGVGVQGVQASFAAVSGHFDPVTTVTDAEGVACSVFHAPMAAGSVTIRVEGTAGDGPAVGAEKTVEVMGAERADASGFQLGRLSSFLLSAGVGLVAGAVVFKVKKEP